MKYYRLTQKSFIRGALLEEGAVISFQDDERIKTKTKTGEDLELTRKPGKSWVEISADEYKAARKGEAFSEPAPAPSGKPLKSEDLEKAAAAKAASEAAAAAAKAGDQGKGSKRASDKDI